MAKLRCDICGSDDYYCSFQAPGGILEWVYYAEAHEASLDESERVMLEVMQALLTDDGKELFEVERLERVKRDLWKRGWRVRCPDCAGRKVQ